MNPVERIALSLSKRARLRRAELFRSLFIIDEHTRILDLGSETGANIDSVLDGTSILPCNVYIADIDSESVTAGAEKFGFTPVLISENKELPFPDKFFDIVYCSSVIEHVTVPKDQVWLMKSGDEFRRCSRKHQSRFAGEIKRLGKGYFVQCPYRYFLVESHSWLPFIGWLPRPVQLAVLKFTNKFWIKKTAPDWNLLNKREMKDLFPEACLVEEKVLGMTKSIMAIYRDSNASHA